MTVISKGKEYASFEDLLAAWREEEKLWPWYKKVYYKWRRSNLWPSEIWYYIRTHTYNRYHILDMRNRFYRWGWCDRRGLLLHASFNLLCKFIEEEKPPKQDDDPDAALWDRAYREMHALYDWWKNEREEHYGDEKAEAKDQEMLHRLIEVRQALWM